MPPAPITRAQARRVDQLAIERLGIAGIVLMENAGGNAARAIIAFLVEHRIDIGRAWVAIVCGGGNNGGDGYVIARHLHNAGVPVKLFPAVDPAALAGDALANATIAIRMGLDMHMIRDGAELEGHCGQWEQATIVVDALLGTGFSGQVRPHLAAVIQRINAVRERGVSIVAIDLPSGLDCDTGQASNATVRADLTVTFVAPKVGFSASGAAAYTGRVIVAPIGVPDSLVDEAPAATDCGS